MSSKFKFIAAFVIFHCLIITQLYADCTPNFLSQVNVTADRNFTYGTSFTTKAYFNYSNPVDRYSITVDWTQVPDGMSISRTIDNTTNYGTFTITGTAPKLTADQSFRFIGTYTDNCGTSWQIGCDIVFTKNYTDKPTAPTNLTSSNITCSGCNLTWTASAGATSYNIYRNGFLYKKVSTTTTSSTDCSSGTSYSFNVTAVNGGGESAKSNTTTITTPATPATPATLLSSNTTCSGCNLTWTASTGATSYNIYRNNLLYKTVSTTAYTSTDCSSSTVYTFKVSAVNCAGESSQSSAASITTTSQPIAPTLTGVKTSATGCLLSWNAISGALQYRVSIGSVTYAMTSATSFSLSGFSGSMPFYVSAITNTCESSQSNVVTLNFIEPPKNFAASNITCAGCNLTWTASSGASSYNIYRNGIFYKSVTTTNYSLSDCSASTTYSFTICAVNSAGESVKSNIISITTAAQPIAPTLTKQQSSSSSCTFSWNAISGATGYYFKLGAITTIVTTATSYTLTGFTGSITCSVSAITGVCTSPVSNSVTATLSASLKLAKVASEEVVLNSEDIIIFPSPATDILNVKGIINFDATLFDMSGKQVLAVKNANGSIDISSLKKGFYLVSLSANGVTTSKKFEKK